MAMPLEPPDLAQATGEFGLPDAAVNKLRGLFAAEPRISRVLVYGSRALGRQRPASDIDIALDAPDLPFTDFLRLMSEIDDLLLPWQVDLALLSQIDNPDLLAHIARAGRPLWEHGAPVTQSAPTRVA